MYRGPVYTGTALSAFLGFSHLILTIIIIIQISELDLVHAPFSDEENKAQRSQVTCPK